MRTAALAGLVTAVTFVGAPTTARPGEVGVHVQWEGRHGGHVGFSYRSDGREGRYRPGDHHGRRGYGPGWVAAQRGFDRGYSEGMKDGIKDARKRRRFSYWRHKDYRNANRGYKSRYGPRPYYSRAFRSGYEAGYRQGYGRRMHHRRRGHGYIYEQPRY